MAMTTTKRSHDEALADAEAFRALFPPDNYERWEFAGSLRRKRPEVADVEHVIIPKLDAYGRNLLWKAAEAMVSSDTGLFVSAGKFSKHVYGASGYRWGEKYRGCDFRGFNHEIFLADTANFGCIFLIRTGPAEFSERVVTRLKQGGMYRQQDGYLIHVQSGERVSVPDERTYLKYAGLDWVEPKER